MRKISLSLLLLLLVGGLKAQQEFRAIPMEKPIPSNSIAKEASSNIMGIGYCGELTYSITIGPNTEVKAAIQFPKETMKKYVGNQLTKVLVGTGTDTGIKNAQVYLSYTLEGEPFYTQDVTFQASKWNEISLTTPYDIEEKEIFVGYTLTSGPTAKAAPVGADKGPFNDYGDFVCLKQNGAWQWGHFWEFGPPFNVAIKAVLEGNSLPQHDLSMDYIMPSKGFITQGENVAINGTLRNNGAQTIKNFDIVYQIGNDAPTTLPVQNANIANMANYDFKISNLTINNDNATPIKVTISNLNGIANPETDLTQTVNVVCLGSEYKPRKVLMEHFTTAQCPNCPAGHTTLKSVLGDNQNVIWVAHHAGYYTDSYTIAPSVKYTWFYNADGRTYAPAIMLDRANLDAYGAGGDGKTPVFGVSKALVQKTLKARLEAPAYVTVDINSTFDVSSRVLNVTVSGKAILGNLPGIAQMNIFLTEDGIIGTQSGGGSKYTHDHVIRAVVTNDWGNFVSFDAEGNYSVTYSYTIDNSWNTDKMKIAAFLSNYDAKNPMNCEVYNAEVLDFNSGSGINSTNEAENIHVSSANSQITINGEYTSAVIYDATGKVFETLSSQQNTANVTSGIYIIKVTNNEQVFVKKVAVK